MRVGGPVLRLYATLGGVSLVALGLALLLARPRPELKPDRSTRAFELDEPPLPPFPPDAAP